MIDRVCTFERECVQYVRLYKRVQRDNNERCPPIEGKESSKNKERCCAKSIDRQPSWYSHPTILVTPSVDTLVSARFTPDISLRANREQYLNAALSRATL